MWVDFLAPPPPVEEVAEAIRYGERVVSTSSEGTVVSYIYKGQVFVTSVDITNDE